jgi:predicted O-methyltransferase YrrM
VNSFRRRLLYSGLRHPIRIALWVGQRLRLAGNRRHRLQVAEIQEFKDSPGEFVESLLGSPLDAGDVATAQTFFRQLQDRVKKAYGTNGPSARAPSIISESDAIILDAIVRRMRPAVVVETGVSDGVSSAIILRAMNQNERGSLHSVDFPPAGVPALYGFLPGWVVPHDYRSRWSVLLGPSVRVLPELLSRLGRVDVFFHDSEHSYKAMKYEFAAVTRWMPEGAVVSADDSLANDAILDTATELSVPFSSVISTRDGFSAFRIPRR